MNESKVIAWAREAEDMFRHYVETKDDSDWKAFGCCVACIHEYDRKFEHPLSTLWASIEWLCAYQKKEISLERLKDSGWFDVVWNSREKDFYTCYQLYKKYTKIASYYTFL